MTMRRAIRIAALVAGLSLGLFALGMGLFAAAASAQPPPDENQAHTVVLDRVVAVVNRRVILASDVEDEMQLSVLEPSHAADSAGRQKPTRQRALEQLISRALIEQQIRQEDEQTAEPPASEIAARLHEIRAELPACVRANCASDAGWKAFLAAHGLTPQRVETYMLRRLEVLRFIEQRFRQGIQISQQQIATYYTDTLLPQYAPGEAAPTLAQVAPRIQEILLEQQVNALFDDWLANLRKQGDVEILDPALEAAAGQSSGRAVR
jgi:hypothetical protein